MQADSPQSRNVLILDPANFIGGAELFMLDFLKGAAAHKDITFVVGTTGLEAYVQQVPESVPAHTLFLPRLKSTSISSWFDLFRAVRLLRRFVREKKIDVILSNSVRANVIAALALPKKVRLVWMLHDFTFPIRLMRFLAKKPHKIVCVSRIVQKYFLSATRGKWEDKTEIIPNGVDLGLLQKRSIEKVTLPQKKNDEYWIGNIGRIEPWKGQLYFLKAARRVLSKIPAAYFFVIGSPVDHDPVSKAYYEEIKTYVTKSGLSHKIIFTGYLKNVYPLLSQLDILVHTAVEPEPFGRVIVEGMAFGKTVIASPLGGPAETLEHEKTGLLVDPRDTVLLASTILELCNNPAKRALIGAAALRSVKVSYQQAFVTERLIRCLYSV